MAAQKGSALLIKLGDNASPETFTALAGLRTKTLTINRETVDITNSDSTNKMRQLLAGAGIKSVSASGAGVFTDAAVDASARTAMFADTFRNLQIVVPDFGTFEGLFQFANLQYAGEHNAEVTYEVTLESAGDVAFEAAV